MPRTRKSLTEQAFDLKTAILSLQFLKEQVVSGRVHLVGHLVTELRALTYWNRDQHDANYDPLLLRMAYRARLPLPVYAMPDGTPPVSVKKYLQMTPYTPQFTKEYPGQQLMDLQDWFDLTAIRDYHPSYPSGVRSISHRKLLGEVAHTLGCAHYDSQSSDFAALMSRMSLGQMQLLYKYFCNVADVVVMLGDWVLGVLSERRRISV